MFTNLEEKIVLLPAQVMPPGLVLAFIGKSYFNPLYRISSD